MLPGIDWARDLPPAAADTRTQHIPIVMWTAKGERTDAVMG
jgi:hypothetical protein